MAETMHGCDLSNYQPTTPGGYDFYMIKASEGNGYKDPRLDSHYNTVAWMGKPFGFYHYARPDLGNTPEAEADWFLSLVGQHAGNALFALDWEGKALEYPADWPLRWCKRVFEKTGVKPLFYCSQYPLNGGKYKPIADFNCGLWMAQYAPAPDLPESSGWSLLAMWQSGSTPVDQDIFYGDIGTWRKYCQKAGIPAEEPKKKTLQDVAREVIAGQWGNGQDRIQRLERAGYDAQAVQKIVNESLVTHKTATLQTGLEILKGAYGNGQDRVNRLKVAGYDTAQAQAECNRLVQIAESVVRGYYGNEPARSANLRHAGLDPETVQQAVNIIMKR